MLITVSAAGKRAFAEPDHDAARAILRALGVDCYQAEPATT